MKIRPNRGKAFVRMTKAAHKIGSLFVPETARKDLSEGTVVAVGEGRILDNGIVVAPPVAEGDLVLLPPYGGEKVKPLGWENEGEGEMVVVSTNDILGVVEK